jgi:hypothetical protein
VAEWFRSTGEKESSDLIETRTGGHPACSVVRASVPLSDPCNRQPARTLEVNAKSVLRFQLKTIAWSSN